MAANVQQATAPAQVSRGTSAAMSQLANMYFFFAINEALVLRSTRDLRVWRAVLLVLLIADFGHLYSMKELGPGIYYNVTGWNAGDIGNVPWVYAGATLRFGIRARIALSLKPQELSRGEELGTHSASIGPLVVSSANSLWWNNRAAAGLSRGIGDGNGLDTPLRLQSSSIHTARKELKMAVPDRFTGFQSPSAGKWLEFEKGSWEPRPFGDYDVDIKTECCGVCASDRHTISGDWGDCPYPLAVGHEVVGKVIRVGPKVTLAKVGQRVGVGAQVYSCLECRQCKNENETYCKHQIDAYGAPYLDTGYTTQGGYSSHSRIHEYWTYPIPEALESTDAAPMLCAGITVFSPLKRFGAGPGKKVGIVGIGGLGHYGIMFAKALGAETWAISRTRAKEADARKMGADGFLATSEKDWTKGHEMTFDLIVNTANSFEGFALGEYLSLLDVHGRWNSVGLPGGEGVSVRNQDFLGNGCFIGSSHLGSRKEMLEMLDLAATKGIHSWVEKIPISKEGLQQAMNRLADSSVRYRSCMVNYEEAFGA
ncbi:hypothetical protein V8C34DRAFT_312590 [Trichoderma compactum]